MKTWSLKRPMRLRLPGAARFLRREDGIGTLEIVLIAAVLILVAILFKDWIMAFIQDLMGTAEDKAETIFD